MVVVFLLKPFKKQSPTERTQEDCKTCLKIAGLNGVLVSLVGFVLFCVIPALPHELFQDWSHISRSDIHITCLAKISPLLSSLQSRSNVKFRHNPRVRESSLTPCTDRPTGTEPYPAFHASHQFFMLKSV